MPTKLIPLLAELGRALPIVQRLREKPIVQLATELHNILAELKQMEASRLALAAKIHKGAAGELSITEEERAVVSALLELWKLIRRIL